MTNKTNDEKLRILQERLTQIKNKKELSSTSEKSKENLPKVDTIDELSQIKKNTISFRWLKYIAIIFGVGYCVFYLFNNTNLNSLTSEKDKNNNILISKENKKTKINLEYNLNLKGDNIVITATFLEESSAKSMVNDLKIKGFKADYFYLPNKSNSTKEVYKVFIGPYENTEESNQWTQNLAGDFEIIPL